MTILRWRDVIEIRRDDEFERKEEKEKQRRRRRDERFLRASPESDPIPKKQKPEGLHSRGGVQRVVCYWRSA